MQMVYNSDSFVVVQFHVPADASEGVPVERSGYEIVDKLARREIFIEGTVAEGFKKGVQEITDQGPDPEALDEFIARYTAFAQHPVALH